MENAKYIALLEARITELENAVFKKPSKISSPRILGDLIKRYRITASQASDVAYQIRKGDLKSDEDIQKYLKKQSGLVNQAKNNPNYPRDEN